MLQNRQIVRTVGNQIEYIVCVKDAITDFHSIVWMFIAVSVTIYTGMLLHHHRGIKVPVVIA
jgi:hypothetical protein